MVRHSLPHAANRRAASQFRKEKEEKGRERVCSVSMCENHHRGANHSHTNWKLGFEGIVHRAYVHMYLGK
jgi:hypothetical protein